MPGNITSSFLSNYDYDVLEYVGTTQKEKE